MEAGAASVSCSPLCVFPWALGFPERAHFTQTTRHQTPVVILLRQPVDVSRPQEIGNWSRSKKSTVIFPNVEKSGRRVVTSWREWVTGSLGRDAVERWLTEQQRGRAGRLMQRLQRLNNLQVICNPNPFSLKSLWAKLYSKQMKVICWVCIFFLFPKFPSVPTDGPQLNER